MKDIGFVIPYFGKFNNYFQIFLNSCARNSNCDWLIFTNDKREFIYPGNVIVHYVEFSDIQERFRGYFDFDISLDKPYKLCDYKPFYGLIFSEYLDNYRFWGYCDLDMIFGNISSFVTERDLNTYDKIGILGHCTLIRNDDEINKLCLKPLAGMSRAREVLSKPDNHSFDEEFNNSINSIFEEYGKRIDYREHEANIYRKSSDLRITRMDIRTREYLVEKRTSSFFVWDNGRLYRFLKKDKKLYKEEYMYIHLQARQMKKNNTDSYRYKIIANAFDNLEYFPITDDTFDFIRKKHFNFHYFRHRTQNLIKKIKKKLRGKL